jgi:hypothetical protein
MVTKRRLHPKQAGRKSLAKTPLFFVPARHSHLKITPKAKALFSELVKAADKAEWWTIHNALHDELGLMPWQWPAVLSPRQVQNPAAPRRTQREALERFIILARLVGHETDYSQLPQSEWSPRS